MLQCGAKINVPLGIVPYYFCIHGQIYHQVSPLYSNSPGYGQLYTFDSRDATNAHMSNIFNFKLFAFRDGETRLNAARCELNPLASSYIQIHSVVQSNRAAQVKIIFMKNPNLDLRRYNAPTSKTEVAAIFVGEDGEPPANQYMCMCIYIQKGIHAKKFRQ